MKKLILCCSLLFASTVYAQQPATKPTGGAHPKQAQTGRLMHQRSYAAKEPHNRHLSIADPALRTFNSRPTGAPLPLFGSDGILGLPKGTYGYAKGQLWFQTTDATSIGGVTGNSSVGTGSAAGGVGMSGQMPGVNGKGPRAGATIWGSAQGLNLTDSVQRKQRYRFTH